MANGDSFDDRFDFAVKAAVAQARNEALGAGIPLFYRDSSSGLDVMQQPDGRVFEIRFIPGAPRDSHYEVLRELGRRNAA
jgi:hypothetical protein